MEKLKLKKEEESINKEERKNQHINDTNTSVRRQKEKEYEYATTKRKEKGTNGKEKKKKGPRKIFGTRRNCLPFPTEIVIIQYLNWYVSKGLCYIYSKLLVGLRNTNHEARDTVWYVINNFGLEFFH